MGQPKQIKYDSRLGTLKVIHQEKAGSATYVLKGGHQTAADRNGVSLDTYIHAIYGFLLQTSARDILMIGCGGGSLGTMLAHAGRHLTVVDIDKNAFKIAKQHFHMPRAIKCRVGDGLKYMQRTRARYDAVIIDAFIGEKIPKHMKGDELCGAARRCLRSDGVLFMNVCLSDRTDLTADKLAGRFVKNGWNVRVVDTPRIPARNAIILGGAVDELLAPGLLTPPTSRVRQLTRELKAMRFRAIRTPRRRRL